MGQLDNDTIGLWAAPWPRGSARFPVDEVLGPDLPRGGGPKQAGGPQMISRAG